MVKFEGLKTKKIEKISDAACAEGEMLTET